MKFYECPDCGANLDHGEICDCRSNEPTQPTPPDQPTPEPTPEPAPQRKERMIA